MRHLRSTWSCVVALSCLVAWAPASFAQTAPDVPGVALVHAGHGKVRLTITAGPSGAPSGFTVYWMLAADLAARCGAWPAPGATGMGYGHFTGSATLNTWGAPMRSFQLASSEALDVEVGDLADESGVSGTVGLELADGEDYVFCVYADGGGGSARSALSATVGSTTSVQGLDCTYTQGFWKTHPEAIPVPAVTLGTLSYDVGQMLDILGQSVVGNGLVALAHQLIATKLNGANGADLTVVAAAVAAADALIGGLVVPPVGGGHLTSASTSALTQVLDDFNQGVTGPGHCTATPARESTWGRIKMLYR
jgi:hypothetical protein